MRDIDNDIRSSLERLTDPHDSTPGTEALWGDLVGRRRKRRNRNRTLAALPLLLVAVLAVGILSTRGSSDSARSDVAAGGADTAVVDRWESLPDAPISARTGAVAIATDDELVIWGGRDDSGALNDGAAYSFSEQAWTEIADGPLSPREDAVAVWTGEEVLIWGGATTADDGSTVNSYDGASWNPETNTWTEFPESFPKSLVGAVQGSTAAAWTGTELVLVGVVPGPTVRLVSDTMAFNPATGDWRGLDRWADTGTDSQFAAFATDRGVLVAAINDDIRVNVSLLDPDSGEWTDFPLEWEAQNPIEPGDIAWTGTVLTFVNHDTPGTVYSTTDNGGSMSNIPATGSELRLDPVALDNGIVTVGDKWFDTNDGSVDVYTGTWNDPKPVPADLDSSAATVAHDGKLYAWNGNGYVWTPPIQLPVDQETSDTPTNSEDGSLSFEPFTMRYRTTQQAGTEFVWTLEYMSVEEWSMELVSTTSSASGYQVGATQTFKDGKHTITFGPDEAGVVEERDEPLAPLQVLHRGPIRNFDTLYGQPAEPAVHEGRNGYETTETIDCPHGNTDEVDWCGNPGGQVTLKTFYEFNSDGVPVLVHSYIEGTNPLVWRFEVLDYEPKD